MLLRLSTWLVLVTVLQAADHPHQPQSQTQLLSRCLANHIQQLLVTTHAACTTVAAAAAAVAVNGEALTCFTHSM
jgi:hypothetical protein